MANRIYESDNELLDQMHKEYDAIYAVKLELTGLKNELLASEDALELEMNSLKLQQAEADTKRASLVSDTNTMKEKETQMENEAKMLAEVIRMLQKDGEYAGGNMCWPSGMSQIITSPYGRRYIFGGYSFHYGIDIGGAPIGAPILAANSGTVISAGYDGPGYGNYLMIDHGGGIVTLYAHASALLVTTGDEVKRGQQIAKIGSTGNSTGPHLHFEIRVNGSTQDPLDTSYDYYVTPGKYFYD